MTIVFISSQLASLLHDTHNEALEGKIEALGC